MIEAPNQRPSKALGWSSDADLESCASSVALLDASHLEHRRALYQGQGPQESDRALLALAAFRV
jgi:hypothetical protein